jgi:hypothetical protein
MRNGYNRTRKRWNMSSLCNADQDRIAHSTSRRGLHCTGVRRKKDSKAHLYIDCAFVLLTISETACRIVSQKCTPPCAFKCKNSLFAQGCAFIYWACTFGQKTEAEGQR